MSTGDDPVTSGDAGGRWHDAGPELIIAAVTVIVAAAAAGAVAGWPGVVTVAAVTVVLAILLLRRLVPRVAEHPLRLARSKATARPIAGYSQRRFVVATSFASRATYERDLRPSLEHILAARLAERHGVNLYTEPERARRAFCRNPRDESLWRWIDPGQALTSTSVARMPYGIPHRTLARLITKLEQL